MIYKEEELAAAVAAVDSNAKNMYDVYDDLEHVHFALCMAATTIWLNPGAFSEKDVGIIRIAIDEIRTMHELTFITT